MQSQRAYSTSRMGYAASEAWVEKRRQARNYEAQPHKKALHQKKKTATGVSKSDKRILLISLVLLTMLGLGIAITTSVSADIAYKNEQIKLANKELESDIQTMELGIQSSGNLGMIEKSAKQQLGMVYPEGAQFVEISPAKHISGSQVAKGNI